MKALSIRLGLTFMTVMICCACVFAVEWTNFSNYREATSIALRGDEVWMSAKGGLVMYHRATGEKTFYKKAPDELPSLSVERVAVHPQTNDIWIGTYDNGLAVLHDDTWTHIPFPDSNTVWLYEMKIAPNGAVWCATSKALYRYENNQFTTFLHQVPAETPWDIDLFPDGKLLCGHSAPFIFDPADASTKFITTTTFAYGTSRVYVKNANEYFFGSDHGDLASFHDTTEIDTVRIPMMMRDMAVNSAGELLLLTDDYILRKRVGNEWQNVDFIQGEIACFAAGEGELWAGGALSPNKLFHRNTQSLVEEIDVRRTGLSDNWVYHISTSADDNVLILTQGGVQKFDLATRSFSDITLPWLTSGLNEVIELDGRIYAGTSTAYLYEYSEGNGWRQLGSDVLPHPEVTHLNKDAHGNLWMCGYGYAAKYDGVYFTVYDSMDNPNLKQYTRALHCDETRNVVWCSTYDGIFKIDNGTVSFYNDSTPGIQQFYDAVETIAEDADHNIWFGTVYGAVLKFDGSDFSTVLLPLTLGNQLVTGIAFVEDVMYVSDNLHGVWKYENNTWSSFNEKNSKLTDDYVTSLHADKEGNLWIGHFSYGVDVYNKDGVSVRINPVKNELKAIAYPNPTEGKFMLHWKENETADVRIFSMEGKLIQQFVQVRSGSMIDLGYFHRPGIYFAEMKTESGTARIRLLVQ